MARTKITSCFVLAIMVFGLAVQAQDQSKPVPLAPQESARKFQVADDLEIDLVLSEPTIAQPVFFNFDERGRMWVVNYLQYPQPAGVKVLSHDKFWRAVYDKVPPPPPNHVRGADKITIHEDSDGDGVYDFHKTFIDGLNMCTAVCRARGGAWVLNPPYLLFYPDRDNDDVPDGDPEVHLAGFGLEDTHSVVNSLCLGPDGWLYAAQGSTVSADVMRPGIDKKPVHSLGQNIWRYHPERKIYEIFSEGGGNAFGVEIDSQGRIFSGHNGGDTHGFHYMQGAYLQKGFQKHGPLSNPYAFGYFPAMKHAALPRFTHSLLMYEAEALPEQYRGKMFSINPLLNHVALSERIPVGSTFETRDISLPVKSEDRCFRPVDIKLGPDGNIYIADWYDADIAHLRNAGVPYDNTTGRIYRLRAKGSKPARTPDYRMKTTAELVGLLSDKNRWVRRTALQLIGDRKDRSVLLALRDSLRKNEPGQIALETLWAIQVTGGFDEELIISALDHSDPQVRMWAVRLAGDQLEIELSVLGRMKIMAYLDANIEVLCQLACTAKRMQYYAGNVILEGLLHNQVEPDQRLPLLTWWGFESFCDRLGSEVVRDGESLKRPIAQKHLASRLMQRFAATGSQKDLLICAKLFASSPDAETTKQFLAGFEEAYKGRALVNLPPELVAALAKAGGGSLALRVRQKDPQALAEALAIIADNKQKLELRTELIHILAELKHAAMIGPALQLVMLHEPLELRQTALMALQVFDEPHISRVLLLAYRDLPAELKITTQSLLVSRPRTTKELLEAVDAERIKPSDVPLEIVRKMLLRPDAEIEAAVKKHWGTIEGATTEAIRIQVAKLGEVIRAGQGDPKAGQKLYMESCGKCHTLFGQGGEIGPNLTADKRDDIERMLLNILNPSAEIREGYESQLIVTDDGRILQGFIIEQDPQQITLRGTDGQTSIIPRAEIEEQQRLGRSLMPEGLLDKLSEQQVRDLFAYLRITQPLVK